MNRRNGNWLARFINQLTATAATVRAALSGYPSINALRRRAKAPPTVQPFGLAIKFLFGLWQLLDVARGVLERDDLPTAWQGGRVVIQSLPRH
jgi:hypothetical protein